MSDLFNRAVQDWYGVTAYNDDSFSREMLDRVNIQIEEVIKNAKILYPGARVDKILFERRDDMTTRITVLGTAPM